MAATHVDVSVDATPEGWQMFSLENWVRCTAYLVRRFADAQENEDPDKRVKVVSVTFSLDGIKALVRIPKDKVATTNTEGLAVDMKAMAELPLTPCGCGCGIDLSVTTCVRDDLNESVGKAEPTDEERKLAKVKGKKAAAVRAMMGRTGLPQKDCQDALGG
jgi:hypothetical protein